MNGRPITLALHLSPEALALLDAEPRAADAIKLGPWVRRDLIPALRARRPLLLHSLNLILSAPQPEPEDGWPDAEALIADTGTPWVSEHLGFAAESVTIRYEEGAVTVESARPLDPATAAARIAANLAALRERLPVPVLAENLDYVPNPAYAHVTEPDFIRQVIEAAGVGLLLDIAHARIAADWLDMPERDYLAALPLERAVEWHVNGALRRAGRLWDAHAPLTEHDLDLLAWLLPRAPALRAITLEYAGEGLGDEIGKLRRLLDAARG